MSIANLAADDDDGNAAQVAKPVAEPDPKAIKELAIRAKKEAEKGMDSLSAFWKSLNEDERKLLPPVAVRDLKAIATEADKKDAE
jgi:hypothetical protein